MQINKPGYYAIIPADVRYDERLRANAKLFYAEITALCNKRGYCTASNEYFAGLFGLSSKTVSQLIGQLVDFRYVFREVFRDERGTVRERRLWIEAVPQDAFADGESPSAENGEITLENGATPSEIGGYPPPKNGDTSTKIDGYRSPEEGEFSAENGEFSLGIGGRSPKNGDSAPEIGDHLPLKMGIPPPKNGDTSPEKWGYPPPKNGELLDENNTRVNTPPIVPKRDVAQTSYKPEELRALYNTICVLLPTCTRLTDKRARAVAKLRKAGYTLDQLSEAFRRANRSSFCTGNNERGWHADFDWLAKEDNLVKVLEGKYDGKAAAPDLGGGGYDLL